MRQQISFMVALVIAGEAVFGLPFVVARVFRPTLLDVFQITNTELGAAFAVYGVVAMLSYFPGGPLADRFSARRLMSAALLATALGGAYYVTIPGMGGLNILFGFWGMTTILLFWAAMIRATREWGGKEKQGRAFGILDGGRGLLAAVLASATTLTFELLLPVEVAQASLAERAEAFKGVLWIFTGVTALAAAMVWFLVPEGQSREKSRGSQFAWGKVFRVLKNPAVWLQGAIVVAAYVGYKGGDDFGLFAKDAFQMDEVESAQVVGLLFWVRPLAAFAAGWIGDYVGRSRAVVACFGVMGVVYLVAGMGWMDYSAAWMLVAMVAGSGAAVFGLRGLYFSLFERARVSPALTGTAAGLVSVIGYTPDIFMGPIMGYFLDNYPGTQGHELLFVFLAVVSLLGLLATLGFQFLTRSREI